MLDVTMNIEGLEAVKRRLQRTMARAREVTSRSPEESASHWAKNIALYLYKECVNVAPSQALLASLPERLNYRIKRTIGASVGIDPHNSVNEEVQARIRHRKFLASAWLSVYKIAKRGHIVKSDQYHSGIVTVIIEKGFGTRVHIVLTNSLPFASEIHAKYGITAKALNDERMDLAEYIAKKTKEDVATILGEN